MLIPKRTKYKKYHKGIVKGKETRAINLDFGMYGLISLENGRIKSNQIEAARKGIVRKIKRVGKLWIRIFPYLPVTAKPSEVRMGKGKGSVRYYVAPIRENRILFELSGVPFQLAKQALEYGSTKLPVKTKFIYVNDSNRNNT